MTWAKPMAAERATISDGQVIILGKFFEFSGGVSGWSVSASKPRSMFENMVMMNLLSPWPWPPALLDGRFPYNCPMISTYVPGKYSHHRASYKLTKQ